MVTIPYAAWKIPISLQECSWTISLAVDWYLVRYKEFIQLCRWVSQRYLVKLLTKRNSAKIAVYDSSAFPRRLSSLRWLRKQTKTNQKYQQTQNTKGFRLPCLQGVIYCNLAKILKIQKLLLCNFFFNVHKICNSAMAILYRLHCKTESNT